MTAAATMLAERPAADSAAPPDDAIARETPWFGAALRHALADYCANVEKALAALSSDINVTLPQVQMLAAIKAHPGASQTDLVAVTGIDRSTLADIARRLVRKQLIHRHRTKKDARAYAIKLTPEGLRALAAAQKAIARLEASLRPKLLSTLQQA